MIFFTGLFFILEFVAVIALCVYIVKLDKKVNALTESLQVNRHNLKFKLKSLKDSVEDLNNVVEKQKKALAAKKTAIITNLVKSLLFGLVFAFIKRDKKKKMLILQLVLMLYDSYKAYCRA